MGGVTDGSTAKAKVFCVQLMEYTCCVYNRRTCGRAKEATKKAEAKGKKSVGGQIETRKRRGRHLLLCMESSGRNRMDEQEEAERNSCCCCLLWGRNKRLGRPSWTRREWRAGVQRCHPSVPRPAVPQPTATSGKDISLRIRRIHSLRQDVWTAIFVLTANSQSSWLSLFTWAGYLWPGPSFLSLFVVSC